MCLCTAKRRGPVILFEGTEHLLNHKLIFICTESKQTVLFISIYELIENWDGSEQLNQFTWLLHIKATAELRLPQTTLCIRDAKKTRFLGDGGALLRFHRNCFYVSIFLFFTGFNANLHVSNWSRILFYIRKLKLCFLKCVQ